MTDRGLFFSRIFFEPGLTEPERGLFKISCCEGAREASRPPTMEKRAKAGGQRTEVAKLGAEEEEEGPFPPLRLPPIHRS